MSCQTFAEYAALAKKTRDEDENKDEKKTEPVKKVSIKVFMNETITEDVLNVTTETISMLNCTNTHLAFANKHAKQLRFIDCAELTIPRIIYADKLVFIRTRVRGFGNLLMTLVEEVQFDCHVIFDPRETSVFSMQPYIMANADLASETFYYYLPEQVMPVDILDVTIPELPEYISDYIANTIVVRDCRRFDAVFNANTINIVLVNCIVDLTAISKLVKKNKRLSKVVVFQCYTFGVVADSRICEK